MLLVYCLIRKPEGLFCRAFRFKTQIYEFFSVYLCHMLEETIFLHCISPLPSHHTSYGQQTDRTFIFP